MLHVTREPGLQHPYKYQYREASDAKTCDAAQRAGVGRLHMLVGAPQVGVRTCAPLSRPLLSYWFMAIALKYYRLAVTLEYVTYADIVGVEETTDIPLHRRCDTSANSIC